MNIKMKLIARPEWLRWPGKPASTAFRSEKSPLFFRIRTYLFSGFNFFFHFCTVLLIKLADCSFKKHILNSSHFCRFTDTVRGGPFFRIRKIFTGSGSYPGYVKLYKKVQNFTKFSLFKI